MRRIAEITRTCTPECALLCHSPVTELARHDFRLREPSKIIHQFLTASARLFCGGL
jgi:hypothetical protein